MNFQRNARSDGFWLGIGAYCYAASQGLVVVLVARSFGTDEVGQLVAAQAIGTPLAVVSASGLRELLGSEPQPSSIAPYLLQAVTIGIMLGAIATVAIAATPQNESGSIWLLAAVLASNVAQAVSAICYGRLLRLGACRRIAMSNVATGTISIACIGAAGIGKQSLAFGYTGVALGWSVVAAWDVSRCISGRRAVGTPISWRSRRSVTVANVAGPIQISSVRLLVGAFSDTASLGVYGTLSSLNRLFVPAFRSAARALGPAVVDADIAEKQCIVRRELRVALRMVLIATPLAWFMSWFVGPWLATTALGDEYGDSPALLGMIGAGLPLLLAAIGLTELAVALGLTEVVRFSSIAAVAVTVGGGVFFVAPYGALGGALILAVANLSKCVIVGRGIARTLA